MKTRLLLSILYLSVISFTTVINANDKTNESKGPVITLIAPAENDILQIGKAIHFDMDLADEDMLDSYRVEIHNNFDGHAHSGDGKEKVYPNIFDKAYDVSGSQQKRVHHHGIVIPADAKEGFYHFIITCKNAAGKETRVIRSVMISPNQGTIHHH